jgi:hypothetical protein
MIDWINFFVSPEFQAKIRLIRFLAFLLILFFLGTTIYFLAKTKYLEVLFRKSKWLKDYRSFKAQRPEKRLKAWKEIEGLIGSDLLSENKLGVVKAGDLLDKVLREAGYPEKDWAERLNKALVNSKLDLSSLHQALELRKGILENPEKKIEVSKLKKAVENFQKALDELRYF